MPAQGELNGWQPQQRAITSVKIINCSVRIAFSRKAGAPISANQRQCNNPEITAPCIRTACLAKLNQLFLSWQTS